jgi:hypothetical protein
MNPIWTMIKILFPNSANVWILQKNYPLKILLVVPGYYIYISIFFCSDDWFFHWRNCNVLFERTDWGTVSICFAFKFFCVETNIDPLYKMWCFVRNNH